MVKTKISQNQNFINNESHNQIYKQINCKQLVFKSKNRRIAIKQIIIPIRLTQINYQPEQKMSLTRKTYSPMSHTYSFTSLASPSYSYSRVSTYLDALQKDEQINKLRRELTSVKSLEMKYYALVQDIGMAEKQNRMLEGRNEQVEREYIEKVQQVRKETGDLEGKLETINVRLTQQQRKVQQVQEQIQDLLQQLKQLKLQEESIQQQNNKLESQIESCNSHLTKLTEQQSYLTATKSTLCAQSKHSTQQMQHSFKRFTQLTSLVTKYTEELSLLQNQSQCFTLECQNMQTLCAKNMTFIQNLQRKVVIQQGENQQIRNELSAAQQEWEALESKFAFDKENLYQNVIKVQEHGLVLKDTLGELDQLLQKDSTQKKYLKDISTKHAMLTGQNEEIRQLLKQLQNTYTEKKAQEAALVEQITRKLKTDEILKCFIQQRTQELTKLRLKFNN